MLSSSSSGIEQESLPTVSSSVDATRVSPLVYLHLKRSIFLQLKLYTWGSCLATGGVTLRLALNSSMVAAATVLAGRRFQSQTVRWKKEFLYV